MTQSNGLVLVTGATGAQGGAVARSLLAAGTPVRVLTRNVHSDAARELARLGAQLAQGDWDDAASLLAAMQGAHGVFSVQRPDADNSDSERRHGRNLIEAAQRANVLHFVHTSVCEAGKHTAFPRWESGYWYQKYWTDKWDVEEYVRSRGLRSLDGPEAAVHDGQLRGTQGIAHVPALALGHDTHRARPRLPAADGRSRRRRAFTRAALQDPARFNRRDIDLAAGAWTMAEAASLTLGGRGEAGCRAARFTKGSAHRRHLPRLGADAGVDQRGRLPCRHLRIERVRCAADVVFELAPASRR